MIRRDGRSPRAKAAGVGRKNRRDSGGGQGKGRGKHRSIRHEAREELPGSAPRRAADAPPEILLRKLRVDEALARLDTQLRAYLQRGRHEVLVVHGQGHGSAGGVGVLGPAVRDWCDQHPALVAAWREAPQRWGGAGVTVVVLRS